MHCIIHPTVESFILFDGNDKPFEYCPTCITGARISKTKKITIRPYNALMEWFSNASECDIINAFNTKQRIW